MSVTTDKYELYLQAEAAKEKEQMTLVWKAIDALQHVRAEEVLQNFGGSGITPTDTGARRLAHTAGMLLGIRLTNEALANKMAKDFYTLLNRLATYGGVDTVEVGTTNDGKPINHEFPRYRVILGDDGTLGGFTVRWFNVTTKCESNTLRHAFSKSSYDAWKWCVFSHQNGGILRDYIYQFNGGLLLHGFGEVFAVDLSPKDHPYWSIHT